MERKGIILAGGNASRLYPLTNSISKQLLPVYDKPMIYYPLSTLLLAGIEEILIIVNPRDLDSFRNLLKDGSHFGVSIKYAVQEYPGGLAEAFLIAEEFLDNHPSALILGDNLFHGNELLDQLKFASSKENGATIFAYRVHNPNRYGVVEFDNNGKVLNIEEKPEKPKSKYAITGLYFYDESAVKRAKEIKPSPRNELEITDLNNSYLKVNKLRVQLMGRGLTWLDTGTFDSFNAAGAYIRTIQNRQGLKISCPEEIVWRLGKIDDKELTNLAQKLLKSGYGEYLLELLNESQSEHLQLERHLKAT